MVLTILFMRISIIQQTRSASAAAFVPAYFGGICRPAADDSLCGLVRCHSILCLRTTRVVPRRPEATVVMDQSSAMTSPKSRSPSCPSQSDVPYIWPVRPLLSQHIAARPDRHYPRAGTDLVGITLKVTALATSSLCETLVSSSYLYAAGMRTMRCQVWDICLLRRGLFRESTLTSSLPK